MQPKLYVFLNLYVGLNISSAFQIAPPSSLQSQIHVVQWNSDKTINQSIQLNSSNDESNEEPQELILGGKISDSLKELGSEEGWLAAARKRNEEAKAKMMDDLRKEEEAAEAKRRAKEESGIQNNYGPEDMSTFKGFINDGFEESEADDATGAWGSSQPAEEEKGGEEEPKLFLFGDDDKDSSGSGLIL